jgi:hypothetical protein
MSVLLSDQGDIRTTYELNGRIRQVDYINEKARISKTTWPDVESAKAAWPRLANSDFHGWHDLPPSAA